MGCGALKENKKKEELLLNLPCGFSFPSLYPSINSSVTGHGISIKNKAFPFLVEFSHGKKLYLIVPTVLIVFFLYLLGEYEGIGNVLGIL